MVEPPDQDSPGERGRNKNLARVLAVKQALWHRFDHAHQVRLKVIILMESFVVSQQTLVLSQSNLLLILPNSLQP